MTDTPTPESLRAATLRLPTDRCVECLQLWSIVDICCDDGELSTNQHKNGRCINCCKCDWSVSRRSALRSETETT